MQKQYDIGDISKLLDIMARLRDPDSGCPWDLEQDFGTIAPYTIEEAYEVADAIEREAWQELPDELGDLLFQVAFHARMAEEAGLFAFSDVVEAICSKMLRRHPHVFGDSNVRSSEDVARSWDRIKREEKGDQDSLLDGVAVSLPALTRAVKLGKRAAGVGFDWPEAAQVRAKVDEELGELDAAVQSGDRDEIEAEAGDLLFAIANYCRHLKIDPELALKRANDRFSSRFRDVEASVGDSGRDWGSFEPDELETFWALAKARERG
jgi:ATP diphosphatase